MPKEERRAKMEVARKELVQKLVTEEPRNWRMPADLKLKDYAEAWANEILPIAREAHERLNFASVHPEVQEDGSSLAFGSATEKPAADHVSYRDWSARITRDELHKSGMASRQPARESARFREHSKRLSRRLCHQQARAFRQPQLFRRLQLSRHT